MTKPGIPAIDRILDKCVETSSGCWEFGGTICAGYGVIRVDGATLRAHRVTFEHFRVPIPEGLVTDHLCENKPCVNPWHLEPVTRKVNTQRAFARTHCAKGHELTPENTYHPPSGVGLGRCRVCIAQRNVPRQAVS